MAPTPSSVIGGPALPPYPPAARRGNARGGPMAEMLQVLDPAGKATKAPELKADDLKAMYRAMLATRLFDARGMNLQRQGRIGFFVPSSGQEASQVGTAFAAAKDDWIYPSYRTHSIAILR